MNRTNRTSTTEYRTVDKAARRTKALLRQKEQRQWLVMYYRPERRLAPTRQY